MIAKIYIIIFALIIVGYIVYFMTMGSPVKAVNAEHFTTDEDYESRLHVIKVFDGYLHRNPTMDEISKYSMYKNEQDILSNVMKDFKSEGYANDTTTDTVDVIEGETVDAVGTIGAVGAVGTVGAISGDAVAKGDKVAGDAVGDIVDSGIVDTSTNKTSIVPKMKSIIQELQDIADMMEKSM